MQASLTNILQRHWEWQEDRRTDLQPGFFRYNTAFMSSLDVKTAFDVAKLLAEMMDVRGSACFEK